MSGHVISVMWSGSCDWVMWLGEKKRGGASKPISLLVRRASKVLIGINWFCELVWQYPVDILFVNICRLRSAKPHVTAKYPKTCSDLYKQTKTQKMLSRQKYKLRFLGPKSYFCGEIFENFKKFRQASAKLEKFSRKISKNLHNCKKSWVIPKYRQTNKV